PPPLPYLHSFPTRRSSDLWKWAVCWSGVGRVDSVFDQWGELGSESARGANLGGRPAGLPPGDFCQRKILRHNLRGRVVFHDRWRDRKSTRLNSSHVAISYA